MQKLLLFGGSWLLVLFISTTAYAQDASRPTYWISGGIGKSQFPSGMLALGYEFNQKPTLLTARYSVSGEILQPVEPGIRVCELGVLYGLKIGKFRFSTGLSTVWGNERGQYLFTEPDPLWGTGQHYEFVGYRTVGVPAEIRFITALKYVGIGVTGFGNWNARRSFAGINLSVYVGRLK